MINWNIVRSKHVPIVTAISLVVLTVLIGIVVIMLGVKFNKYDDYKQQDFIDSSGYQAVFLTNDQIYFGHLKNISSNYLILFDVYYVKINESGAGQLVKLGQGEPHGPQDKMIINQDQVVYWENLKPNSPIVETIGKMKSH